MVVAVPVCSGRRRRYHRRRTLSFLLSTTVLLRAVPEAVCAFVSLGTAKRTRCRTTFPTRGRLSNDADNISTDAKAKTYKAIDMGQNSDAKPPDTSGVESQHPKRRKRASFPASSYPLSEDESALRHSWISFIDYPPWDLYSQVTRLVEQRRYARRRQFDKANWDVPPAVDDVALPRSPYSRFATALAWNGLPARGIVFSLAYFVFPAITSFLDAGWYDVNEAITGDNLETLLGAFLPGISIVLGTLISLTISILYDRIGRLQGVVSEETALLLLVAQRLVEIFHSDEEAAVEFAQCIADQVRTLVRESRGREIMGLVYSDPYARILKLIAEKEREENFNDSSSVSEIRGIVKDLMALRAKRMSEEALALPSTHFEVLTFLCAMLLGGYSLGTVAVIHGVSDMDAASPPLIAQVLFALIVCVYVLIYEFAFDLNRPFYGTYQLRRSSVAMHLLEIKMLFSQHPLIKEEVDFEEVQEEVTAELGDSSFDSYRRHKKRTWYY